MGFGRGILLPEWAFLLAVCCIHQIGGHIGIHIGSQFSGGLLQKRNASFRISANWNIFPPRLTNLAITSANPAHNGRVCSTWGNFHFKTFDGDIFTFPGLCNYVFASHCNAAYEDFNIQIRREVVANTPTINRISMKLEGVVAELTKDAVIVDGNRVQLPYSQSGITIEKSSIYVKVGSKVGVVLLWNEKDSILLELNEKYANQTCGLCGDFNGFPIYNEFISNNIKMTALQFGNLQKMDGPTEHCEDSTSIPTYNCSDNLDDICEKTLTSSAFADCNDLVDVKDYIKACQDDLCSSEESKNSSCICDTFAEYSRQCAHAGGQPLDWRTSKLCPKTCPYNMQYQECNSPCTDTCTNPERSLFCEEHCIDGCFCPPGTVFDDINNSGCIPQQECSCIYNGKTYATGASFSEPCQNCTCNGGQWSCQDKSCPGTCSVAGGSHISTYDKKHYDHHGDCTYVLSKDCKDEKFTILAELRKCGLTDTETCLKSVTLNMNKGQTIVEVKPDGGVFVNSIYTQLPMSAANVTMFRPSSFFMIMVTSFGVQVEVQFTPVMQVFVRLDASFKNQTCGLCGNFNNIQTDDFKVISGIIEGTASAFANTWKTQASCPNIQQSFENPCALSIDNEKYAQHWCGLLTNSTGPFAACHNAVNPAVYHTNCMFDTCNCENSEDCLCAALSAYVRACAAKGIQLQGWRTDVCTKYTTTCPKSLSYSYTISSCQPTCRSLSEPDVTCNIKFVPVDGCTCVNGTYMDDSGKCVPANECPCYYKGSPIPFGEVVHENGRVCTCVQGRLNCIGASNPTSVCESPMVYFDCENNTAGTTGAECQKSCQTLDMQCYSSQCTSGCICPDGLVLDGNGGCIPEEECPCIHNEAMYQPGEKISFDCNTCPKAPPPEGVKSNPSKRHRERLNQELNKLTGLLPFPEDVRSRLDKLSILRLAVGYLKVKSYLRATAPNIGNGVDQPRPPGGDRWTEPQGDRELFPEGELLLQALNGFVIAVTGDGYIFYISPTVQDYLGFHQSDLIYQSVYELIHADDRAAFRLQLHGTPVHAADTFPPEQLLLAGHSAVPSSQHLHAEKQSFVERSFTCRFRCLLDNSSGFLALNFHGRLKFLLGQQKSAADKSPVALFAIATLLQPLSILELQTKTLIFQTKHKLDFTPMACDSRGKVVLGYTEVELCRRGSGYQFVHAADMMHCAEHHVRMMKTGESGLTVFRLLTKRGSWVWVQANARLVYKGDRPDCIIARQRALSNEEGEEHLQKRNLQLPFSFATGEAVLYGNDFPGFLDSFQAKEELQVQANSNSEQRLVDPNSLLGAMMKQDASIYNSHADNVPQFSLPGFIREPDGLTQKEDISSAKEESNSLLVIIETLFEKSEVDGNDCQSLNMGSTELQQWEEALLSLGAEEEPPAQGLGQRPGTKVTSYVEQMLLREGAGKSLDFPHCHEENSAVAHFQHCWTAGSAFPAQPQAAGTWGGQGPVGSVGSVPSEGSFAQPEQQIPFHPAGPVAGTVLGVPISSSKSSAALQLANQAFQAEATLSTPVDNTLPAAQSQPGCQLVGSPPVHSNTLGTLCHNVPLQANPASCPSEASLAIPPKQLEAAGAYTESQTLPGGSPENPLGAGLWLPPPSQSFPCPAQGLHESLFSGDGKLCHVEVALPAPLGARQLPGHGSFPKQPLVAHAEPTFSWEGEQAVLQEGKWFSQLWLPQAGAAPQRSHGAGPVHHSGLQLGSSTDPSAHQMDCFVLSECQYGNSLFRHESTFLRDAAKTPLPQQPGVLSCPAENRPGAPCSSPDSVPRCSAALPVKVGAGAPPCSGQSPGCPSIPFSAGQPPCACEIELKVRCEGCRT